MPGEGPPRSPRASAPTETRSPRSEERRVGKERRARARAGQCGKRQVGSNEGTVVVLQCFFFSSRRRHTRLQGDWSSDVCFPICAMKEEAFGEGHRQAVAEIGSGLHGGNVMSECPAKGRPARRGRRRPQKLDLQDRKSVV